MRASMWLLNLTIAGIILAAILDAGVGDVALVAAAFAAIAVYGLLSLIGWGGGCS